MSDLRHNFFLLNIEFNFSDGNYEYSKSNEHGTLIDPSDTSAKVTTYGYNLFYYLVSVVWN